MSLKSDIQSGQPKAVIDSSAQMILIDRLRGSREPAQRVQRFEPDPSWPVDAQGHLAGKAFAGFQQAQSGFSG